MHIQNEASVHASSTQSNLNPGSFPFGEGIKITEMFRWSLQHEMESLWGKREGNQEQDVLHEC